MLLNLPVELLDEICWQSGNLKLTLVCTFLCDMIHSTRHFWGCIYISRSQVTDGANAILRQRLERGATFPLNVSIKATKPSMPAETELWKQLGGHKDRFHSVHICTDMLTTASNILKTILNLEEPERMPCLHSLTVHYQSPKLENTTNSLNLPRTHLRLVLDLAPALTTLVLPCVAFYIPYLSDQLPSLETLVLRTSFASVRKASIYQILLFLSHAPNLKTFWCKTHDTTVMQVINVSDMFYPGVYDAGKPVIPLPVVIPRLSTMSLTVHGYGAELLLCISTPRLHSLLLDDTPHNNRTRHPTAAFYPFKLFPMLERVALDAPGLRRLAFLGVSPSQGNNAWKKLLGCMNSPAPFLLLESIAMRMKARHVRGVQLYDDFGDDLVELYALPGQGRIALRRLALTGCGPRMSNDALHSIVRASCRRLTPGQVFELEVDGQSMLDQARQLGTSLDNLRVKAKLHAGLLPVTNWWDLGQDIDPSEENSF